MIELHVPPEALGFDGKRAAVHDTRACHEEVLFWPVGFYVHIRRFMTSYGSSDADWEPAKRAPWTLSRFIQSLHVL